MQMLIFFGLLLAAAIVNLVGPAGLGLTGAREGTWLLTLGLFAGMLVTAGHAVASRWDGIFIDRDNRISLSRFQLITWTALIVSALFTGGLTNMTNGGNQDPLLIAVPNAIWALLGLGAFSSVAAPAIEDSQKQAVFRSPETTKRAVTSGATATGPDAVAQMIKSEQGLKGEARFVSRVLVKESPTDARWIDLINGDNEGAALVDVSKLQKLVFTLMLLITYGAAIWASMAGGTFKALPEVYPGFVALLGISHATYLADKQLGST